MPDTFEHAADEIVIGINQFAMADDTGRPVVAVNTRHSHYRISSQQSPDIKEPYIVPLSFIRSSKGNASLHGLICNRPGYIDGVTSTSAITSVVIHDDRGDITLTPSRVVGDPTVVCAKVMPAPAG
jgi:hypothetical protein